MIIALTMTAFDNLDRLYSLTSCKHGNRHTSIEIAFDTNLSDIPLLTAMQLHHWYIKSSQLHSFMSICLVNSRTPCHSQQMIQIKCLLSSKYHPHLIWFLMIIDIPIELYQIWMNSLLRMTSTAFLHPLPFPSIFWQDSCVLFISTLSVRIIDLLKMLLCKLLTTNVRASSMLPVRWNHTVSYLDRGSLFPPDPDQRKEVRWFIWSFDAS